MVDHPSGGFLWFDASVGTEPGHGILNATGSAISSKMGTAGVQNFQLIPPGIGIVHQVNLEYLAKGVLSAQATIENQLSTIYFPDTLVGTDSPRR